MKVQGRFFQPLDLRAYPLDIQTLTITVEDNTHTRDVVVYQPDIEGTGLDSTFRIPGWNLGSIYTRVLVHDYKTDFGEKGATGAGTQLYSAVQFSIDIHRSQNVFAWRLLVPLILVLSTCWMTLILHPRYVEVRTAMCATALLTTVFLQQSSIDSSQVTSLTLMDTLYVTAYVLIVLTFALIIWDNNLVQKMEEREKRMADNEFLDDGSGDNKATKKVMIEELRKEEDETVRQIRKVDLVALVVQIIIAVVVMTTLGVTLSTQ